MYRVFIKWYGFKTESKGIDKYVNINNHYKYKSIKIEDKTIVLKNRKYEITISSLKRQ